MQKLYATVPAVTAAVATSLLLVFTDFVLAGTALREPLPGLWYLVAVCVVHGLGVHLIVLLWIMRGYVAGTQDGRFIDIKENS